MLRATSLVKLITPSPTLIGAVITSIDTFPRKFSPSSSGLMPGGAGDTPFGGMPPGMGLVSPSSDELAALPCPNPKMDAIATELGGLRRS